MCCAAKDPVAEAQLPRRDPEVCTPGPSCFCYSCQCRTAALTITAINTPSVTTGIPEAASRYYQTPPSNLPPVAPTGRNKGVRNMNSCLLFIKVQHRG